MTRPAYSRSVATVRSLIVTILGAQALTAFAAHTLKLLMPQSGQIIGVHLNVQGRGGTHSTSTLDVQDDGVSILASTFNIASLTPGTPVQKEGAGLAAGAANVAKDSVISLVTAESGGTSPTWQNATVQIDYIPLGD